MTFRLNNGENAFFHVSFFAYIVLIKECEAFISILLLLLLLLFEIKKVSESDWVKFISVLAPILPL